MSDLDQAHDAIHDWYRAVSGYQRLLAGMTPPTPEQEDEGLAVELPIVEFTAANHDGQPLRIRLDLNRLTAEHRQPVLVGLISLLVEDYGQCLDKVITTFTALENQHLERQTTPPREATAAGSSMPTATPNTLPTTAGG